MRFDRYLRELVSNYRDSDWWYFQVRGFLLQRTIGKYFEHFHPDGIRVVDEDWDVLILLDACRYDMFEETVKLDGRLEKCRSLGSSTPSFLSGNFDNGTFHDIVYVTGNPQIHKHLNPDIFHAVVDVWKDGWDDEFDTVRPETMVRSTLSAAKRYPNKRIISHFLQPHYPFIGERGQAIENQSGAGGARKKLLGINEPNEDSQNLNVWTQLRKGYIDRDKLWEAYFENLELALNELPTIINNVTGKIVISSDHGNMASEFAWPFPVRIYGHPGNLCVPDLVTVPWFIPEFDERRQIKSEPPTSTTDIGKGNVEDRLEDLGYLSCVSCAESTAFY